MVFCTGYKLLLGLLLYYIHGLTNALISVRAGIDTEITKWGIKYNLVISLFVWILWPIHRLPRSFRAKLQVNFIGHLGPVDSKVSGRMSDTLASELINTDRLIFWIIHCILFILGRKFTFTFLCWCVKFVVMMMFLFHEIFNALLKVWKKRTRCTDAKKNHS